MIAVKYGVMLRNNEMQITTFIAFSVQHFRKEIFQVLIIHGNHNGWVYIYMAHKIEKNVY